MFLFFQFRDTSTNKENDQNGSSYIGLFFKGLQCAKNQSQYVLKCTKTYSETVLKVIDPNMGKKGLAVIHFDRGLTSGSPHININPRGFPCKTNPHIGVSQDVIVAVEKMAPYAETIGKVLDYSVWACDIIRLGCSFKKDIKSDKEKGQSELVTTASAITMEKICGYALAKAGASAGLYFIGPPGYLIFGFAGGVLGAQQGNYWGKKLIDLKEIEWKKLIELKEDFEWKKLIELKDSEVKKLIGLYSKL